ncbi:hypothetical protein BJ508DRAFT_162424 [Ascobolus immersus RN42]|uniref:Uncharacterized protein n=1 Tax=Ascobolus immersus RN42 TaxID=1160509 RepID=A0A3N4HXR8_ASCIM|nr:hypothetical protein BJ508DRAFT_162424 [Ascobolus immersus RN42]
MLFTAGYIAGVHVIGSYLPLMLLFILVHGMDLCWYSTCSFFGFFSLVSPISSWCFLLYLYKPFVIDSFGLLRCNYVVHAPGHSRSISIWQYLSMITV